MAVPTSVNGVVGPFGYFDGMPNNNHQIRFPEQTIAGITYEEARTNAFGLNQNWTFNITLTPSSVQPARATTLTTSIPSSVAVGQTFNSSGVLTEASSGVPIPNQTITLSYNGANLGSVMTGSDGRYQKSVSIPSAGPYTLKAYFAGNITLGASESMASSNVIAPLLAVLGTVAASVLVYKHFK